MYRKPANSRRAHWAGFLLALVTILGWSCPAEAESVELTAFLDWHRAPDATDCATGQDLRIAVERRLARKVFAPIAEADRRILGRVQKLAMPEAWEAELVLQDSSGNRLGSRKLKSLAPSCQTITADIALIIALLVDLPKQTVEVSIPTPKEEPYAGRPTVVLPPSAPTPDPSHLDFGIFGSGAYGLFPDLHWGGGLSAALSVPGAPTFEFGLKGAAPSETSKQGPGARFFGASSHLLACTPFSLGAGLELSPCSGVEIGLLQVEGIRLDQARSSMQPLVNIAADMRLLLPVGGPVFLQSGFGGLLVLRRDSFTYGAEDGSRNEVHRPAAIVPTAHLGFVSRLHFFP